MDRRIEVERFEIVHLPELGSFYSPIVLTVTFFTLFLHCYLIGLIVRISPPDMKEDRLFLLLSTVSCVGVGW